MNTTLRLILCGLALGVPAVAALWSQEPALPRTVGRVLVLDNEHTLEGDILLVGDDYRIRRAVGETWVPGNKVLRLCASWEDAYTFLSVRANQNDPDERVRLARWCQVHGLTKQALAEVNATLAMRPSHAEARRLQKLLRRAVAGDLPVRTAAVKPQPAAPLPALARVDLGTESMSQFATHVQPILMNACASCHANNRGGEFRLMRSFNGSANQRAMQYNLAAVIAQIDRQRPALSPLLIKAVSMHGTPPRVPLKGRQTAAFQHLQQWVDMTLATNPHLVEETGHASPARVSAGAPPGTKGATAKPTPPAENVATFRIAAGDNDGQPTAPTVVSMSGPVQGKLPLAPVPVDQPKSPQTPRSHITPQPEPPPPADPVDAFDPVIFNRQMHPDQ